MAWVNTFIYVAIAVAVETVFGVLVAALINHVTIGRQWLLAAVILPWALPGVVNAVIWMWIYQPGAGLLNGILTAFGLPYDTKSRLGSTIARAPFVAVVDRPYLVHDAADRRHRAGGHADESPANLYEAAPHGRRDAASQMFFLITLPPDLAARSPWR